MSSIAEYHVKLSYDGIEKILLNLEADKNLGLSDSDVNFKYKFQFSGNSVRLTSTELSCLLFTINENLWWLFDYSAEKKLLNNYSCEIKDNLGNVIFREKAGIHNGKPAILVEKYVESTMSSVARDLLRDIIPNKGSLSPKQRLWS